VEFWRLKSAILDGEFLSKACFYDLDLDAIFDGRDDSYFDAIWVKSFKCMEPLPISSQDKQQVDKIRELAFKSTYKYTGDPDLSAYVSDDFELIAKAFLLDLSDPFVNALWLSYRNNIIPAGKIELKEGRIRDL
jgi:hypothetical protein